MTFSIGLLAPVLALLAGWIYHRYASTAMDMAIKIHEVEVSQFGFAKLMKLGRDFWILAVTIFFYFGVMFTIMADYPKFLTVSRSRAERTASLN